MSLSCKTLFLAMACAAGCFSCGDCVETPSLASISPTSATAGSGDLVLVVNGNHFQRNSTVDWNGAPRPTTFLSGHQLKATISAADLAQPATTKVTVFSPPQSQPVTFGSGTSSGTSMVKVDCVGGTSGAAVFNVN